MICSGFSISSWNRANQRAPMAPSTGRWSTDSTTETMVRDLQLVVVADHRLPDRRADGQDAGLRRVDDRVELLDAEHAQVADGQRAALQFGLLQLALIGPADRVLDLAPTAPDRDSEFDVRDHRGDQAAIAGHRDGDVGGRGLQDRFLGPDDVHLRHVDQRLGRGLHEEVVDRDPLAPAALSCARSASSSSTRERDPQVEVRGGLLGRLQPGGNELAQLAVRNRRPAWAD